MEYFGIRGTPVDWNIGSHPKGEKYRLTLFEQGFSRKSTGTVKYGHVSIDANLPKFSGMEVVVDGLNTAGLSLSTNVWRGLKVANSTAARKRPDAISFAFLPKWILSSFAKTSEVAEALKNVTVTNDDITSHLPGIHWAVADKDGHSIVIEYNDWTGKPQIYDNQVRVLTNDPPYPWQVKNLDQFSYLSPEQDSERNRQIKYPSGLGPISSPFDEVPESVGVGYNLKALPGDSTAASRFARIFYLKEYAVLNAPPKDITCALTLGQALANSMTIPRGTEGGKFPIEFTQWVVLKVPHMGANGTYMVRSYVDMQWRSFDLSEADLKDGAPSLRTSVETGHLNVADGLGTLKSYHMEEDEAQGRRLGHSLCTIGAGIDRLDDFSCNVYDIFHDGYTVSRQTMLALAASVGCCTIGACVGFLFGRQYTKDEKAIYPAAE
eukprot:TRINITY_DN7875_c1_g1_i1.p1 TRINITY_DN7875_c1_g1~~TRINITY_DN7875_c1_g1_i1.p1  ORF type:complete len:494 (-),score=25.84 TRINITY_DN7875_c1_g1_i1:333-1640(-)